MKLSSIYCHDVCFSNVMKLHVTYLQATIRRAELQKARALQSYYEAKTKRERKIKSKK